MRSAIASPARIPWLHAAMGALAIAALAVGAQPAGASPIGTTFRYQGRLTDAGGAANALYDFELRLFDAAAGAGQVGPTVVRDDVTVAGGLFSMSLDFGAVFDGSARFLEVAVRPGASTGSYTTLVGRQELSPAPYGLYATSAATAASVPWAGVSGKPAGFADNLDGDTLGGLACAANQIPKLLAGAWSCANDDTGAGGSFWGLAGNAGAGNFLGSTDNQPVEVRVNNARALRLEPTATSPNVIAGYGGNAVTAPAVGAVVAGGGLAGATNRVSDDFGTVSGGRGNQAGNAAGTTLDKPQATVGGGSGNVASGAYSTIPGGRDNVASGDYSFAAGWGAQAVTNGSFVWVCATCPVSASTAENQFIVQAPGGVGIGTNAPAAGTLLDVAGKTRTSSLQVTAGALSGRVLTSDASGNGTWQAGAPPSGTAGGALAGSYPNPSLGVDAVSAGNIAANAVGGAEIGDRQIGAIDIANGAITSNELAINSVGTGQIALGAVNSSDILDATITSTDIANGTVTASKLSAGGASSGQVLTSNGAAVVWQAQVSAPCALSCSGSVQTLSFLNAAGACVASFRVPCFPYACDTTGMCRNACSSPQECASGTACNVAASECVPIGYFCKDGLTVQSTDGLQSPCSPYVCRTGACGDSCTTSADCVVGKTCNTSGRCV